MTAPPSVVTQDGCTIPDDTFDVVLFDEAHHTPAPVWAAIVERTRQSCQVFFTATPYKRDNRRLQATVVYEFPLAAAVEQGYVAPVDLRLIDGGEDIDETLIAEVRDLVLNEQSAYFRVRLMARTSSTPHAKLLCDQYAANGLSVRLVVAETSLRSYQRALENVRSGAAHGLVMVGVLGEGFDFPAIKIVAYHRTHRSLPATLQFIGRVTRIHEDGPARALVVAPRREAADETAALYRDDAQRAKLIPELASRLFEPGSPSSDDRPRADHSRSG